VNRRVTVGTGAVRYVGIGLVLLVAFAYVAQVALRTNSAYSRNTLVSQEGAATRDISDLSLQLRRATALNTLQELPVRQELQPITEVRTVATPSPEVAGARTSR
jgi:hypothetical protein